jgi:hypothetical protein
MKFTLVYDGDLPPNGGKEQKWAIRAQFHPQLEELWGVSPVLYDVQRRRFVPENQPFQILDIHHIADDKRPFMQKPPGSIDLCAPIKIGGRQFVPLVRDVVALKCSLKIIFLRQEAPGGMIYQGGDLDNRLKTLFDALQIPDANQIIPDTSISDPIYCLVENDRLITGCSVETHRLLGRGASKHHVQLVMEVDVKVSRPRGYNFLFLGD